jgi:magnesium-transporting ATPase (P-type)
MQSIDFWTRKFRASRLGTGDLGCKQCAPCEARAQCLRRCVVFPTVASRHLEGAGERPTKCHGGTRIAESSAMTTDEPARLAESLVGLSSIAAAERLRNDGKNELPPAKRVPAWRQLVAQLTHFFAILLWVAGLLAIVGGMPELGIAIFVVIVMNGLFAFLEEHRAERASQHLQRLLPRRAAVQRDGHWTEVDASELVVGDRVRLDAGDLISADLRVVSGPGVSVDQSTLTGESVPVPIVEDELAFAGTFVMQGEAEACVVATGAKTRLARIAQLTQGQGRPRTRLARELNRLVRTVALIALAIGVVFFFVGWLSGLSLRDGFLFAVGVAVALVPEGLLPTVTLSLAVGASAMARRGALVRRLEAIETLGATTYICTDKTGTLTSNEMNAVDVWTPAGTASIDGAGYAPVARVVWEPQVVDPVRHLALAAVRCSTGRALERGGQFVARGDPMEAAIHALSPRTYAVFIRPALPTDDRRERTMGVHQGRPRRRIGSLPAADGGGAAGGHRHVGARLARDRGRATSGVGGKRAAEP